MLLRKEGRKHIKVRWCQGEKWCGAGCRKCWGQEGSLLLTRPGRNNIIKMMTFHQRPTGDEGIRQTDNQCVVIFGLSNWKCRLVISREGEGCRRSKTSGVWRWTREVWDVCQIFKWRDQGMTGNPKFREWVYNGKIWKETVPPKGIELHPCVTQSSITRSLREADQERGMAVTSPCSNGTYVYRFS